MKISVITVVFNGEKYLEESITSFISQTYTNKELIIVDGMSSDNTPNIIKKYQSSIAHYIREPDKNLYDAMNKGIKQASGDIIHLLNHDDYYHNKYVLSDIHKEFQNNEIDVIHGPMVKVNSNGNIASIMGIKSSFLDYALFSPFNHPTCFAKKEVYHDYTFNINYPTAADYDWMLRVLNSTKIKIGTIDYYTVSFRTVGLTSNNWIPPVKQLIVLLRNNRVNFLYISIGIIYRISRNIVKKLVSL